MARGQGAAGSGSTAPSLGAGLAVVVHDLVQARAALAAARRLGIEIELLSPPEAAAFPGVGFLKGLEEALGHALAIDCGEDAGLVMAGLRAGLRDLLFTGDARLHQPLREMAEAVGGRVRDRVTLPVLRLEPHEDSVPAINQRLLKLRGGFN